MHQAIDPAHTIDKGVIPSLLGGLFHNLVFERALCAGSTEDQIQVLNMLLSAWYKEKIVPASVKHPSQGFLRGTDAVEGLP